MDTTAGRTHAEFIKRCGRGEATNIATQVRLHGNFGNIRTYFLGTYDATMCNKPPLSTTDQERFGADTGAGRAI